MSLTQAVVLTVILDLAIIAGLTLVMLTPFRIDRRRRATRPAVLRRPGSTDLLAQEDAAA